MIESLTSYAELAEVVAAIPLLLREGRRQRGLSQRGAADQIGISFSTVNRIENGEDYMSSNLAAIMCWLDQTPSKQMRTGAQA